VLLAEIALSLNSNWTASAVTVDDSRRPFLLPTQLLQDLLAFRGAGASDLSSYSVVAAGYFDMNGAPKGPSYNDLTAAKGAGAGEFVLWFPGYLNPNSSPPPKISYIVKGTVQEMDPILRGTFEFTGFSSAGILVRILDVNSSTTTVALGFMVEISQIGGVS
jgi:hypothetical protein